MWVYNCAEIELHFKSLWDSIKDSLISEYLPSGLFSSSWEMAISWSLQVYFNLPSAITPVPQTILWSLMSFLTLLALHRQMNEIQASRSPGGLTCSSKLLVPTSAANPKVNTANTNTHFRTKVFRKLPLINKIFSFPTSLLTNQLVTWANCVLAARCIQ